MNEEDIKRVFLQILELQLDYQLRAVKQLQGKPEEAPSVSIRRGRRRQSLVDLSIQILTEARESLHVNELVRILQSRFGRLTDRDTLSSALAKKARQGILLRQTAPATFALIESEKDRAKT